jgi:orotidine-5'-phosphate decarboxylase
MREHQAPWVVNVGRGIAEASHDIATWRDAVKAAAFKYHDAMVPMVKE